MSRGKHLTSKDVFNNKRVESERIAAEKVLFADNIEELKSFAPVSENWRQVEVQDKGVPVINVFAGDQKIGIGIPPAFDYAMLVQVPEILNRFRSGIIALSSGSVKNVDTSFYNSQYGFVLDIITRGDWEMYEKPDWNGLVKQSGNHRNYFLLGSQCTGGQSPLNARDRQIMTCLSHAPKIILLAKEFFTKAVDQDLSSSDAARYALLLIEFEKEYRQVFR